MEEKKVDWKKAGKMLCEGYNFTQIADALGVSKQYISAYYAPRGRYKRITKTKYQGFDQYIKENQTNVKEIARELYGTEEHKYYVKLARILNGKTKMLTIDEIRQFVNFTGMPFEELFREYDGDTI